MPILKKGYSALTHELANSGTNFLTDLTQENVSVKTAFKNRAREGVENLKRRALAKMDGNGSQSMIKGIKKFKFSQSLAHRVKHRITRKKRSTKKQKSSIVKKKKKTVAKTKKRKTSIKKKKSLADYFSGNGIH